MLPREHHGRVTNSRFLNLSTAEFSWVNFLVRHCAGEALKEGDRKRDVLSAEARATPYRDSAIERAGRLPRPRGARRR